MFSLSGELLENAQIHYTPYYSPRPGWAEQDPEVYWKSLCSACARLKRRDAGLFERIAGVGVTTLRNSLINVDSQGRCLRPAIIWLDQRKADQTFSATGLGKLGMRLLRKDKLVAAIQAKGRCNWIRQHQPQIWKSTCKYLQVSGFLNHRLTGRFTDSVASQIGYIPFHYKKLRWAKTNELTARLFPVEPEKLPELVAPGQLLGEITSQASKQTGLPEGLPVVACGSDKGCETLGMGVVTPRTVSLSFGTTATIQTATRKYVEAVRLMPPYPALIPGCYNPEVEIFRGFWMISWFKNEFACQEIREAQISGVAPEVLLNTHLNGTPAGAMGLLLQPFWGAGLNHPEAKGAMIGFGDVHTKAHVYRAIIEGLGFALYEGLEKIQRATGIKAEKTAVSGGASQSDEICKIISDIFNLPMVKGRTHETSGLGAAIVTAVGLGFFPSFDEAMEQMVGIQQVFDPDAQNAAIYKRLYTRVYRKMYKALEPMYAQIKSITGYPA